MKNNSKEIGEREYGLEKFVKIRVNGRHHKLFVKFFLQLLPPNIWTYPNKS